MTKYLIIDDEVVAHDIIKGYCDMLPDMLLMKNCYDAIEALSFLNEHTVDLIFLDLNMPKLKGFDFLRTLTNPPKVIVTTAYREFALEGFELNVVDYLLKPFGFERFLKAINKSKTGQKTVAEFPRSTEKKTGGTIFLKSNKKHVQINIKDILFLESAGNYVKVVTAKETILVREKISELTARLPEERFIRIHKSFAIAKDHIKSIEGNRISILDHIVPVGKMYRDSLKRII